MSDKFIIKVQNFQSIREANLDLPFGVTVITGPTNNGKTALIRALDEAIFNTSVDSHIKAGKEFYGVKVDNGQHTMLFSRRVKGSFKTAYQFDSGQIQQKVGRGQLDEVRDMFNIRDIRMQNGTKVKINFWYQNDTPFLMNLTAGQLYEFLSLSSCDRYSRVLKTMCADIKIVEADISNLTVEIDTIKSLTNQKREVIQKNEGFDDLFVEIVRAEREAETADKNLQKVHAVQGLKAKIEDCRTRLGEASSIADSSLASVRVIADKRADFNQVYSEYKKTQTLIDKLLQTLKKIQGIQQELKRIEAASQVAKTVEAGAKNLMQEVSGNISTYLTIRGKVDLICRKKSKLSVLEQGLATIQVVDISQAEQGLQGLEADLRQYQERKSLIDSIQSLDKRVRFVTRQREQILVDIEKADAEFEELKREVGICPFCGTVFDGSMDGHIHKKEVI